MDDLYDTFAAYRIGSDFGGEASGVGDRAAAIDPAVSRRVRTVALRDLTLEDFGAYPSKAITTWGDTVAFKHFLPRLLELAALDPSSDRGWPEVLLGKLRVGRWRDWPPREVRAIEAALHALWQAVLSTSSAAPPIDLADAWLCGIAQTDTPIGPYLEAWLARTDATAAAHLACFLEVNLDVVRGKGRLFNPHWNGANGSAQNVIDWLRSPPVEAKLRANWAVLSVDQRWCVEQAPSLRN